MLGHKSKNYSCKAELELFIISLRQFIFFGYFFYIEEKRNITFESYRYIAEFHPFILFFSPKNTNIMLKTIVSLTHFTLYLL